MCKTIRRTEHSTHTASLSNRSRSVVTCASAQAVPALCARMSETVPTPEIIVEGETG